MSGCTHELLTSRAPGPVALIDLTGDAASIEPVLRDLTGRTPPEVGRIVLRRFGPIDRGLVMRLSTSRCMLMPHGGPRIVSRLLSRLVELGSAAREQDPDPMEAFPEASDHFEALMLDALARATSPGAIDLLLQQPPRWRAWQPQQASVETLRSRARQLMPLLRPSTVALVGAANVGKSTLTNALAGRSASITADEPGTTRDYVGVVIDLAGLVVHWLDTPGIRETPDEVEAAAAGIAADLLERADLIVAVSEGAAPWPESGRELPRVAAPILRIRTKADLDDADTSPEPGSDILACSAVTGDGLVELVERIRDALVPPAAVDVDAPWLFDERLIAGGGSGA
jgi:tRNA modification GTPase